MKTADLDDQVLLALIPPESDHTLGVSRWDLCDALPGVPEKIVIAKLRRLIRRSLVDGCTCGCRGDFTLRAH